MAELTDRPFPPGSYPVVVVGTGPGGLQTSAALRALGVEHALLSADEGPGGMFRRFPFFQRLITWTKPYAPVGSSERAYEWYDWNSLLSVSNKAIVPSLVDGSSVFPSRAEMEAGLVSFAEREPVPARYGCPWEATRREDDGFVLVTSDGEYRAQVLVFAVGMTEPWKPDIPGLDQVPHYVETQDPKYYAGKRVFVIGKRNSGFELADGLLPWARQIVLGSPRPARLSVMTHSTAAARARYLQPYEDYILGGGHLILDAAIDSVERTGEGWRVRATGTTSPGAYVFDVDEVIAATGFATPLGDLPALGVKTFYQQRLPSQTPFFESTTVPGIFFAGSITQGAVGLKKYGNPSSSAAVHGFRYNARVLAEHLASTRFGIERPARTVAPGEVVELLLREASEAPELWNQQAYLARVLTQEDGGFTDAGILPLQHFVDASGPDALAVIVETDDTGDIHPAVYVRRGGRIEEHLLTSGPVREFDNDDNRRALESLLGAL